jgi:hypothetical protein
MSLSIEFRSKNNAVISLATPLRRAAQPKLRERKLNFSACSDAKNFVLFHTPAA